MRSLSSSELLDVWEQGQSQGQAGRGLIMLAAFCPETAPEELARLPIGERDALLLSLREETFGPRLAAVAACPRCGQNLEMNFSTQDVRVRSGAGPDDALSAVLEDYEVQFRLPNSLDMLSVAGLSDLARATQALTERCLLKASHKGDDAPPELLPEAILDEVSRRMAEADPQADVQLALSCPACGREWQEAFDILSFLWMEIDAWAGRAFQEVHALASAYGWSEREILEMSRMRRQAYLDLVGG